MYNPIETHKQAESYNSNSSTYQTFKKTLGLILVAAALWSAFIFVSTAIKILNNGLYIEQSEFFKKLVPEESHERTFNISISLPNSNIPMGEQTPQQNMQIEIPKHIVFIAAIFIAALIAGLILKLILGILVSGVSLMKDDVGYVFERLRKELERGKLPNKNLNIQVNNDDF